jgi:ankyrin repeat protein
VGCQFNQDADVIITLLKAHAAVKARSTRSGKTALIFASADNHSLEVITVLLKAGADAKTKDSDGKNAFYYAQYNESLKGTDALKQLEEASK